jgi:hypothetical protein
MSDQLTANYSLAEFQAVSSRTLTSIEVERARTFAINLLQPLRRAMGYAIRITSFVRHHDAASEHRDGGAVDFQPCRSCQGTTIPQELFASRLESMFQWLAMYHPQGFGTLIHERDHLHATLPGRQGRTGVVLREPEEGRYELAGIAAATGAGIIVPLAIGLGLLFTTDR